MSLTEFGESFENGRPVFQIVEQSDHLSLKVLPVTDTSTTISTASNPRKPRYLTLFYAWSK